MIICSLFAYNELNNLKNQRWKVFVSILKSRDVARQWLEHDFTEIGYIPAESLRHYH